MPVSMKNRTSMAQRRSFKKTTNARAHRSVTVHRRVMGVQARAVLPGQLRSLAPELKALDLPLANYNMNTTAVITPLNLIRTGATFCNRVGRKIEMKSLRVAGRLYNVRTVAAYEYLRILLVYDRQTNGAVPAIADILQTTDQAAANTTTTFSGINLNNRDRFVILRDQRITSPPQTDTAGVETNIGAIDPVTTLTNFDWFVKLPNLVTQYKADSSPAVIGDIASGGLYLVTFGEQASGSEGWGVALESRLRYLDL